MFGQEERIVEAHVNSGFIAVDVFHRVDDGERTQEIDVVIGADDAVLLLFLLQPVDAAFSHGRFQRRGGRHLLRRQFRRFRRLVRMSATFQFDRSRRIHRIFMNLLVEFLQRGRQGAGYLNRFRTAGSFRRDKTQRGHFGIILGLVTTRFPTETIGKKNEVKLKTRINE